MKREDNKSESLAMLPVSSGTKCHHSQVWAACSWRTPYPGQWLQAENHQTNPTTHKTNHFSENKLCHGEYLSTDTLQKEGRASWDRELKVYWPKQGLRRDAEQVLQYQKDELSVRAPTLLDINMVKKPNQNKKNLNPTQQQQNTKPPKNNKKNPQKTPTKSLRFPSNIYSPKTCFWHPFYIQNFYGILYSPLPSSGLLQFHQIPLPGPQRCASQAPLAQLRSMAEQSSDWSTQIVLLTDRFGERKRTRDSLLKYLQNNIAYP